MWKLLRMAFKISGLQQMIHKKKLWRTMESCCDSSLHNDLGGHDGKPKEFLDSTLSGTWTKRSFERFSARQPKKDNHPASDSSCLTNRRMLLLRNIRTLVSWSYIRAKTIIGIQQYQYNRPSRCGRFRRESTYDLEREFARVFVEGPAQSTCNNKRRTSQLNKEQRTNSQQGTHHKQQTTNNTSNINP